jgi:hypothetical protein
MINVDIVLTLCTNYDFNKLVDADDQIVNLDYWESIVEMYDYTDVGIILAANTDSRFEFDGSGTYQF